MYNMILNLISTWEPTGQPNSYYDVEGDRLAVVSANKVTLYSDRKLSGTTQVEGNYPFSFSSSKEYLKH